MDKARTGFTEDLQAIQHEVEADVHTILEIANRRSGKAEPPVPSPNATTEVSAKHIRRRSHSAQSRKPADEPQTPVLQNVTTRLSRETNGLLTEAALLQRLNKTTPDTRQDIIEEAVRDWLRRHAYYNSPR